MSKKSLFLLSFLVILIGVGFWFYFSNQKNLKEAQQADEENVRAVVINFGGILKNISLLSPTASEDIKAQYKDYLDPQLITQWSANPENALGRPTSSPWPEAIEITNIQRFGSGAYDVEGTIVYMTSTGPAEPQAVQLGVAKFGDRWLISGVSVKK